MSSIKYEETNTSEPEIETRPVPSPAPQSQSLGTWLLLLFTSAWLGFTIFFAWNSTVVDPFIPSLLPLSKASYTLTIINILSHGTVMLLQSLASSVFETIRWARACSDQGISSFGFLVLSRATAPLGVGYLLLSNFGTGTFWNEHRLWGFQRSSLQDLHFADFSLWFIALHSAIGIALLTGAEQQVAWRTERQLPTFDSAGLGPFEPNATNLMNRYMSVRNSSVFWYFYSGVLSDGLYGTAISPQSCSIDDLDCHSIFFTGGIDSIYPSPFKFQNSSQTALIVYNSPGYQFEYFPPSVAPHFNPQVDCRVYPTVGALGVGLCIGQEGNDLIAGRLLEPWP